MSTSVPQTKPNADLSFSERLNFRPSLLFNKKLINYQKDLRFTPVNDLKPAPKKGLASDVLKLQLKNVIRPDKVVVKSVSTSLVDTCRPFKESRREETINIDSFRSHRERPKHPFQHFFQRHHSGLIDFSVEELDKMLLNYLPVNQEYSINSLKALPHMRKVAIRNCLYYGQIIDGKRDGKGIFLYYDGRIYEGEWQENQKNGKGIEMYPNGNSYQGIFKNGQPDEYGTYIWADGDSYQGEWNCGVKEGFGEWKSKGESYSGEWRAGKPHGNGVHIWKNGEKYQGDHINGMRHGHGKQWLSNKDFYQGSFIHNKIEGKGEFAYIDGSKYVGEVKNGKKHGHGTYFSEKGEKYEGEFCKDLRHGYGVFTWANGNMYKGEFKEGLREGFGEMIWVDGAVYKGMWKIGVQNGFGEMVTHDKKVLKGMFHNNVLVHEDAIPEECLKLTETQEEHSPSHDKSSNSVISVIKNARS